MALLVEMIVDVVAVEDLAHVIHCPPENTGLNLFGRSRDLVADIDAELESRSSTVRNDSGKRITERQRAALANCTNVLV